VRAGEAARPVLEDLATALTDTAAALIGGDLELAERALSEARRIDALVAGCGRSSTVGIRSRVSPRRAGDISDT
jgi:hypothetical protein